MVTKARWVGVWGGRPRYVAEKMTSFMNIEQPLTMDRTDKMDI